jgi:hypothetical protein
MIKCLSEASASRLRSAASYFFRFGERIVQWLLFPVAILAATLTVVQSGCNGMLEKIIGRTVTVGVVSQGLGLTTPRWRLVSWAFPIAADWCKARGGHGSADSAAPPRCCRSR